MKKVYNFFIVIALLVLNGYFVAVANDDIPTSHEKLVEELKNDISDTNNKTRDLLILQLFKLEGDKAINFLLPFLNDDSDYHIRAAIANNLGYYPENSLVTSTLIQAREDKNWYVRMSVARSLLKIKKEKEAVPVLTKFIQEDGKVYHEMFRDVQNIKDEEVRDSFYMELKKISLDDKILVIKRAYAIAMLTYVYNEPLTPIYKSEIIEAIHSIKESEKKEEISLVYNLIGVMYPRKENLGVKREDCLEILREALTVSDKDIKEGAENLINYINSMK